MSTTHRYMGYELPWITGLRPSDPTGVESLRLRALAAGYTTPTCYFTSTNNPDYDFMPYEITVAEDAVDRATLLAEVNAAAPALLSFSEVMVDLVADGVDTAQVTLEDSRGAAADGKSVLVFQQGGLVWVPVVPQAAALDQAGQATVTFGPVSAPLPAGVYCYLARYTNDEAFPAMLKVNVVLP